MMVTQRQLDLFYSVQKLQRLRSRTLGSKGLELRLEALAQIKKLLLENEAAWLAALEQDLGKPAIEAYASELAVMLNEVDYTSKHLKRWMQPRVNHRLRLSGKEKAIVSAEPYGTVLVLAPWNYPLQLALMPVIGAIAAGNGVILKPSESAPATSRLLAELVPRYLEPDLLFVVEGDYQVAEALTEMEWDFIFFTGSPNTGRKVYQAAAHYLTPVVMELGGKNPCIVDESGFTAETIRQITWGKFLNAGQTCIAPDTVYVPRQIYPQFLLAMREQIEAFYGEQPEASSNYGRIIHQQHLDRLIHLLEDGTIFHGGHYSHQTRFMSPTLLVDIQAGSPIEYEEIFGPILPIIPYDSLDEVITHHQSLPVPLVVYAFSRCSETILRLRNSLESGTFSVNQVMVHATNPDLPFGGKGQSGMGSYHGLSGFKAFTYEHTFYSKKLPFTLTQQYPPYSAKSLKALRLFRRLLF